MIWLSREVRFALVPPEQVDAIRSDRQAKNSWAGWPISQTIAPHFRLRVIVEGTPEPQTGYLCDIQVIDRLIQRVVWDEVIPQYRHGMTYPQLLLLIAEHLKALWDHPASIRGLELDVSPQLSYSLSPGTTNMVEVTQQFEFSAAHRLHNSHRSDDENRATYGKCNNPNGHGHNYVIEITASPKEGSHEVDLLEFQSTVNERVIDVLDHQHLNQDVEYFQTKIPSVENIAIAIWEWLQNQFQTADLRRVRVYETPKTWAEYAGN